MVTQWKRGRFSVGGSIVRLPVGKSAPTTTYVSKEGGGEREAGDGGARKEFPRNDIIFLFPVCFAHPGPYVDWQVLLPLRQTCSTVKH